MRYFRYLMGIVLVVLFSGCSSSDPTPDSTEEQNSPQVALTATEEMPTSSIEITETIEAIPSATVGETTVPTDEEINEPVHGIILFIGDGMGANQRLGAQWLAVGQDGVLAMDGLSVWGLAETSAANRLITDSAAGSTAISTGVKTNYRAIGMNENYDSLETILEQAQARGWAVGLVTTVQMAHATPAAFAAHVKDREYMMDIANQMMAHNIDVLLGGGEDDFLPRDVSGCYPDRGHRVDGLNLIADAIADGYTYVCTSTTIKLIGFFGDEEIKQPYSPSLTEMTQVAIEILSQDPDGFFLMVEGGQIDWESHDNQALETMQLTVGLNSAVTAAQVYALGEPNTLIIVTADHETGGMSLNLDCDGSYLEDGPFSMPDGTEFCVDWVSTSHTAVDIPVTAEGPYSWMLYGEYPNTWIYQVMYSALTGE